jgi:prostaglandin reductase 3
MDFRAATRFVEAAELPVATAGHVVVKNHYVGINAADVNTTNGAYGALPYSCGLEGMGKVAVGEGVENFKVGDPIAYQSMNVSSWSF